MFSEQRKPENSCAQLPAEEDSWLMAGGSASQDQSWGLLLGDKNVEPMVLLWVCELWSQGCELARLPEDGSNREFPWHGDTHLHVKVGIFCLLGKPPSPAPVLLRVVA